MASLPPSRHVEVEGSLDQDHGYLTVQIPVGPTTRELGLSVHGNPASGPVQGPVLGHVSLVDRNGVTLAQLGPFLNSQTQGPSDAVTLSLDDIPAGGTLIVQVAATSGLISGDVSASMGAASGSGWTLPFLMDVQRLDSAAPGAQVGAGSVAVPPPIPTQGMIGMLVAAAGPQGRGVASSGAGSNVEATVSVASASTMSMDAAVMSEGEPSNTVTTPLALDGRIAAGPLAARTAAPIGPNLSSVLVDPAPAMDRHERALSQEIASNEGDAVDEAADSPVSLRDAEGAASRRGSGDRTDEPTSSPGEAVVTVAALGPLSLKISAPGIGDRGGDLDALQAALADTCRPVDDLAGLLAEDRLDDPLLIALAAATDSESELRETPDYLTSACIVALGMGLVTGPIIPDLLRLIPPRSSRWRLARAGLPGGEPGIPIGERGFAAWLRRRLGPRA